MGNKSIMQVMLETAKKFETIFGVPYVRFEDRLLTIVYKRPQIDTNKFIMWLDVPDNVSAKEHIMKKYGNGAWKWFSDTFISNC